MSLHARGHAPDAPATAVRGHPAPSPDGRVRRRRAAVGALLLTLTATPAAVLVVPDVTVNVMPAAVGALDLSDADIPVLLRATGMALPVLLAAVPVAAVAARRFSAWSVLATGLAVLLMGLGAAGYARSVPLAGTVRAVQGAGAGIILPACLVLVWERRSKALTAAWAGTLAGALIVAMPLALAAVPATVPDWRVALAPHQWPAVAAAVAALVHLVLRGRRLWALPASRHVERGQLLLPLVPAAGFAFLAVIAAACWSPGARLVVAGLALPALLGLALAAGRDTTAGSPHGCAIVMITTGLLTHPVAGPLAGFHTTVPLLPYAVAAAAAPVGALASVRLVPRHGVRAGHALMIAAVPVAFNAPGDDGWTLLVPLVLLGTGAGLALAASLRDAGVGAALFGLSLCFPAVLAGQLLVLSLQAARLERLRPVTEAQRFDALRDGYHIWLAVAGTVAVLLAVATTRHTRRTDAHPEAR
ncbi:hypothetical protein BZB76_2686 [Actinomadura pelletieri DSM 43383]|uniref:MFS transporter n=1 Tax=Actinomadura pelletieri DSM 43383 TaxID=1120940 RepID=A0A495QV03_9ACTN|nr:hypothetical protein [Actinomadura pelletieri]RKS77305.1 hypothetical protein BZB76_2686 [Actinomadura pelletieri DSM 43383]